MTLPPTPQPATGSVIAAYDSPTMHVAGLLGTEITATDPDRAIIEPWAASMRGPILDVGSGTGRWTGHLASMGYQIFGLEPSGRLIEHARTRYPAVDFRQGSIADLAGDASRWSGILAWYSVIHLGPDELPEALMILRSGLSAGGSLLMSFFAGPRIAAFQHPVATAYRWPTATMLQLVTAAGFAVQTHRTAQTNVHAYISAVASPARH